MMTGQDFTKEFNAAVVSEDWAGVKVLGEKAIAESVANSSMTYNLGLAYLKSGDSPMAVAVLVSTPPGLRDSQYARLLSDALQKSGSSESDFQLGALGMKGILVQAAHEIEYVDPYSWCAGSLAILIGAVLTRLWRQRNNNSSTVYGRTLSLMTNLVLMISCLTTLAALAAMALVYFYQSRWGAVIASEPAPIRVVAEEGGEVLKTVRSGKPILVLGDSTKPWVRVLEADGGSGWMNALDLRCIRGKQ